MFLKRIVIFGLLSLLACQGANATSNLEELIKKLEVFTNTLNNLRHALKTLKNLNNTINQLTKKYLDEGTANITGQIENVFKLINNRNQEATSLKIDIGRCTVGRDLQLEKLRSDLVVKLTVCVVARVGTVRAVIDNIITDINQVLGFLTTIPEKVEKCLTTSEAHTCVHNLSELTTNLLRNWPRKFHEINNLPTKLVADLSVELVCCLKDIAISSQTQSIIAEINTCVDAIISGGTD